MWTIEVNEGGRLDFVAAFFPKCIGKINKPYQPVLSLLYGLYIKREITEISVGTFSL
jgi:hypothetical protein